MSRADEEWEARYLTYGYGHTDPTDDPQPHTPYPEKEEAS